MHQPQRSLCDSIAVPTRRLSHNKGVKQRTSSLRYREPRRATSLPYRRRDVLLSKGEAAFFRALLQAVASQYVIALKVRAADLITCSESAWVDGFGHMVAKHHLDFVLCDRRSIKIVAAIELDDRSHDAPSRQRRDEFLDRAFAAAKLPLIRFRAAAKYNPLVIANAISRAVDS